MKQNLQPGLKGLIRHMVKKEYLASEVGTGLVNVYSTSMMIAGMEAAAVSAVQSALPEGHTTVGIHVDVEHKAATPTGMHVEFEATLEEVSPNGKGLCFKVVARDDSGLIGEGKHWRVVVDKNKFEIKAMAKIDKLKNEGEI